MTLEFVATPGWSSRLPLYRFIYFVRFTDDGCWIWTGRTRPKGYGLFYANPRRHTVQAHRWAYEHFVGPIPDGLTLDHPCRKPSCVNPEHLEPVTNRENVLRGDTIAARWAARTHCAKGHALEGWNAMSRPDHPHWRRCRECRRERVNRQRAEARLLAA